MQGAFYRAAEASSAGEMWPLRAPSCLEQNAAPSTMWLGPAVASCGIPGWCDEPSRAHLWWCFPGEAWLWKHLIFHSKSLRTFPSSLEWMDVGSTHRHPGLCVQVPLSTQVRTHHMWLICAAHSQPHLRAAVLHLQWDWRGLCWGVFQTLCWIYFEVFILSNNKLFGFYFIFCIALR